MSVVAKRPASDEPNDGQLTIKRQNLGSSRSLARPGSSEATGRVIQNAARTSRLFAPLIELSGHSGEILSAKFDNSGNIIASGSTDRNIMLWQTYGQCNNFGILSGHKGAIRDMQWSRDSDILFSASADTNLASWDLTSGLRIRRYVGHEEIINAMDISKRGEEFLISGSDDGTIGIWDPRSKNAANYISTDLPITAVALSEAGNEIYSGGIENDIKVWDLRKQAVIYTMMGHKDTITSLRVSPDSQALLSYAMDATARTWDIRPFAPSDRQIRTFDAAQMGLEQNLVRASWNYNGKMITAGSADGTLAIWSTESGSLKYKLPGHHGAVNCAEFSPTSDPIMLSASSDRRMLLGELK